MEGKGNAMAGFSMIDPHHFLEGAIVIFKRPHAKKPIWNARFKMGANRYEFKSLKTVSYSEAIEIAHDHYFNVVKQVAEAAAINPLSEIVNKYRKHLEVQVENSQFSKYMFKATKVALSHWDKYCGNVAISAIGESELEQYVVWRNRAFRQTSHINAQKDGATLSHNTLRFEYGVIKRLFIWAKLKGYITARPDWEYKVRKYGNNKRPAMTSNEIDSILEYLTKKIASANDGKIKFARNNLYYYIRFMIYSGLRINEARNIKWHHIRKIIDGSGTENYSIKVTVSKTKPREVIPFREIVQVIDEMKLRERNTQPDDWVFSNWDGSQWKHPYRYFSETLQNMKMTRNADGKVLSTYCLRHTYATEYIRNSTTPDWLMLAENMGTSVKMLQDHYSDIKPLHKATELGRGGIGNTVSDEMQKFMSGFRR